MRTNPVLVLAAAMILIVLAFGAAGFIAYNAFARQSDRVEDIEQENQAIEVEHAQIGSGFQDLGEMVTRANEDAEAALQASVQGRPLRLTALATFARDGFLVPRTLPPSLRGENVSIGRDRSGYSLTWLNGVSLFADRQTTLRHWTTRVPARNRSTVSIGRRKVVRLAGSWVVFAWREGGRTYAIVAPPQLGRAARALAGGIR